MNNKFYASLEVAKLLKEKGYNEETDCVIDDDGDISESKYNMNKYLPKWKWSCPTISEIIDWLEENEGVSIFVIPVPIYRKDGSMIIRWKYNTIQRDGTWNHCSEEYETQFEAQKESIKNYLKLV